MNNGYEHEMQAGGRLAQRVWKGAVSPSVPTLSFISQQCSPTQMPPRSPRCLAYHLPRRQAPSAAVRVIQVNAAAASTKWALLLQPQCCRPRLPPAAASHSQCHELAKCRRMPLLPPLATVNPTGDPRCAR
eukprot:108347-Chlamydomonas_euryale.AAC.12